MSDNKLEALREKERAESLIAKKEYEGARERVLKAQQLFPGLDHIDAMKTVCEILSAATNLTPSDTVDYYWVLQVDPLSPLSSITERYRKLGTMLQPIKSRFLGTDLALKLVQDAFTVLADKVKRLAFDSQRNNILADFESPSYDQSMPCQDIRAARPDRIIACVEVSGEMHDNITTGNAAGDINRDVVAISPPENLCISPNEDESRSFKPVAQQVLAQDFYDFDSDRKLENIELGQIWAVHHQSNTVQNYRYARIVANSNSAVGVLWLRPVPVSDEERRWCEAGLPVACGSFFLDIEVGEQVCSPLVFSYKCSCAPGVSFNQFDIYPKKGEVWALYEDCELNAWSHNPEVIKSWKFKLVELLSDFSKYIGADSACLEKVDGFRSIFQRQNREAFSFDFHISPRVLYRLSHNVPAYRFTGGEINGVAEGMLELDLSALPYSMIQDMDNKMMTEDDENAKSYDFTYSAENPSLLMPCIDNNVSGPNIWSRGVSAGQVWAVYSGIDSMPRQYTRIDNVISATQVSVTFLELQPITDYEINWKNKKLPVVCGLFKAGGSTVNLGMSQLSHPVNYQINMPFYKIYPSKEEIWAVYRKWNSEWNNSDYENCQYSVLTILSDFSEGERMTVARLGKAKGYGTFFRRQQFDRFNLIGTISKSEIPSFSHQIPSFKVPGIESWGVPEICWHLEPDALPLEITSPDYDILDQ